MLNQSECTDKNSTVALTGTRTPGLPRSKAVHTLQPNSPLAGDLVGPRCRVLSAQPLGLSLYCPLEAVREH